MKRLICTFIGCCSLSLSAAAQSFQQSADANKQAYIKAKAEQLGATLAQRPVEFLASLIGIYLPMMESEFRNELVSGAGSAGMFQFMPQTAVRFGITAEERTDPAKSADAAARYLSDLQTKFAGDVSLSLLSYNVGEKTVEKMLIIVPEARGAAGSICVLTEKKELFGAAFPKEGQHYTPSLLAAAIIIRTIKKDYEADENNETHGNVIGLENGRQG